MSARVYANKHPHIYVELEYKLVEFSEVKLGNTLKMSSTCVFQRSNYTFPVLLHQSPAVECFMQSCLEWQIVGNNVSVRQ